MFLKSEIGPIGRVWSNGSVLHKIALLSSLGCIVVALVGVYAHAQEG